jgi:hypothetical protein
LCVCVGFVQAISQGSTQVMTLRMVPFPSTRSILITTPLSTGKSGRK